MTDNGKRIKRNILLCAVSIPLAGALLSGLQCAVNGFKYYFFMTPHILYGMDGFIAGFLLTLADLVVIELCIFVPILVVYMIIKLIKRYRERG